MGSVSTVCGHRVLIVEDDRDVRLTISEILLDHEYQPIEAANGQEAIDHLRADADKPCVILLDIMMPVMDGWQFRAVQREDPELSTIPVVVLTAHANIEEATTQIQPAAFLQKPLRLDKLLAVVAQFCREV